MVDFSVETYPGNGNPKNGIYSLKQIKNMIARERPIVHKNQKYNKTKMTVHSWRDYKDMLDNLTSIISQHPETIPEVLPLLKKIPAFFNIKPIAEAKANCVKMIMYKNKNYASPCLDVLFDEMRFNFDEFGRTAQVKDVLFNGIQNVLVNTDSTEIADKVLNFYGEIQPEEKAKTGHVEHLMGFVANGLYTITRKYPQKDNDVLAFIKQRVPQENATFPLMTLGVFDVWENIASHGKEQSQQVWQEIKPFIRKKSLEMPMGHEPQHSKFLDGAEGKWLEIELLSCVISVCEHDKENATKYIEYYEKNNAMGVMPTLKAVESMGKFAGQSGVDKMHHLLKRVKPFIPNTKENLEALSRINKSMTKDMIKSRAKSDINRMINFRTISQYDIR